LNGAAVGEGTEFPPVAEFLGRKTPLIYRIVEYAPPRAVTFLSENSTVISRDRIKFDSTAAGTRVTSDADLALEGPFRIADPLSRLAFTHVGDRAVSREASGISRVAPARSLSTPNVRKVVDNLGLASADTIAVLLVGRSGAILAGELGGFDEQRADRLASALATTLSRTTASVR